MNALNMNGNKDVFANQEQTFIHLTLMNDPAYQWSVANNDVQNMRMVLRAYGEVFTYACAEKQIEVAKTLS